MISHCSHLLVLIRDLFTHTQTNVITQSDDGRYFTQKQTKRNKNWTDYVTSCRFDRL